MKQIFAELGIERALFVSGLVGAIAGLSGSKKSFVGKLISLVIGVAMAVLLTPLTSDLLEITNEKSKLGIAVLIGYLGIQGIQKLVIKKLEEK